MFFKRFWLNKFAACGNWVQCAFPTPFPVTPAKIVLNLENEAVSVTDSNMWWGWDSLSFIYTSGHSGSSSVITQTRGAVKSAGFTLEYIQVLQQWMWAKHNLWRQLLNLLHSPNSYPKLYTYYPDWWRPMYWKPSWKPINLRCHI